MKGSLNAKHVFLLVLDFSSPGRYLAGVAEPENKLKLSTIIIAAIAGLVGSACFFSLAR